MGFSDIILHWYLRHKRDLPWRQSRDPYRVWLSEIMLQQTRVAQGLPYFEKFIKQYPKVCDLASAPLEEVLKLWQGLGYYSRARNLHETAKKVCYDMGGQFPNTYEGLLGLKGVGEYTAAAIGSICFNLPTPVIDGNVYRLLSRYFGVEIPIDSGEGKKYFGILAREVMDSHNIGDYNQAIMEFGAEQCVPKSPQCGICPLSESCYALGHKMVSVLPRKQSRVQIRQRNFNYIVPIDESLNTIMKQRTESGIWNMLYEFPLLESDTIPSTDLLLLTLQNAFSESLPLPDRIIRFNETPVIHKLSHQHLNTTFWLVYFKNLPGQAIPWYRAEELPVPVLIAKFMETVKNSYF